VEWFDPNHPYRREVVTINMGGNKEIVINVTQDLVKEWKDILETIWTPLLQEPLLPRGTP